MNNERVPKLEVSVSSLCGRMKKVETKLDKIRTNDLPHLKLLVIVSILIGLLSLGMRVVSIFGLL